MDISHFLKPVVAAVATYQHNSNDHQVIKNYLGMLHLLF